MAAIYSKLFFSEALTSTSSVTLYTVPVGFVAVLRDVDVFLETAGPQSLFIRDVVAGVPFIQIGLAAINTSGLWRGRQVFNAGDGIAANVSAGTWAIRASGYLLTA